MIFRPKFITFDCYGTLTRFRMGEMTPAKSAHSYGLYYRIKDKLL